MGCEFSNYKISSILSIEWMHFKKIAVLCDWIDIACAYKDFRLIKMIFDIENWLWKLEFQERQEPGSKSIHERLQFPWSTLIVLKKKSNFVSPELETP